MEDTEDTIKADDYYSVNRVITPRSSVIALFDGYRLLFVVNRILSLKEHKNMIFDNEFYETCETFTTIKGNRFKYARDTETGENFLVRL